MNKRMEIRNALTDDADRISALCTRLWTEEPWIIPESEPPVTFNKWIKSIELQIEQGYVLAAECADRIVGFIGYVDNDLDSSVPDLTAYLTDMYVIPEVRCRGVAAILFRAFKNMTIALGFNELRTNADANNQKVQALLKYAGFCPADDFWIPQLRDQLYYRKYLDKKDFMRKENHVIQFQ
jgi:RimJ/RimL family protein N-acetyltransferase